MALEQPKETCQAVLSRQQALYGQAGDRDHRQSTVVELSLARVKLSPDLHSLFLRSAREFHRRKALRAGGGVGRVGGVSMTRGLYRPWSSFDKLMQYALPYTLYNHTIL